MKYAALFCIASMFVVACSSNQSKSGKTDSVAHADSGKQLSADAISSHCFLRTVGKDSTSIELVVRGDTITGQMNWLPYQKDSRKGALTGTIKNDTIQAKWSFMQEGIKDTVNLKFKLQNNELSQKPLKLNVKTGREQTDNAAGYALVYALSNKVHH